MAYDISNRLKLTPNTLPYPFNEEAIYGVYSKYEKILMGEVLVGYVMRQYMADAQPMHVMIPIAGWTEIYSFCEVSCNLV